MRAGTKCRSPAMANGRCRMHGGRSTGPKSEEGRRRCGAANWKHGGYSYEWKHTKFFTSSAARALIMGEEFEEPLMFLIALANDETQDTWLRMKAASKVLPFTRPKLKPVKIRVSPAKSHEDWLRELQGMPEYQ